MHQFCLQNKHFDISDWIAGSKSESIELKCDVCHTQFRLIDDGFNLKIVKQNDATANC